MDYLAELEREVREYYETRWFGESSDKIAASEPPEHLRMLWALEEQGIPFWSGGLDDQPYINGRALNVCRNVREELRMVKEKQDELRRRSPAKASGIDGGYQWRFAL